MHNNNETMMYEEMMYQSCDKAKELLHTFNEMIAMGKKLTLHEMHEYNTVAMFCELTKDMNGEKTKYASKMSNGNKMHTKHDKLTQALNSNNWKWAMYTLLEDEVHGAKKYLMLHDLAIKAGKTEWATKFKDLASQETAHAESINAMYLTLPYTHGTTEEREMWDMEYNKLIEQHKMNLNKLM